MIAIERRRAYGGKVLPYDAEVEYLEYDGNQYFDTRVLPDNTIRADIQFMPLNQNVESYALLGARHSDVAATYDQSTFALAIWSKGTNIALNDNGYDSGWKNILSYNTIHTVSINERKLYKDGTLVVSSGRTNAFSLDTTYGALRCHLKNNGWDSRNSTSGRLYFMKIWKAGVLNLDLIPVRKGNVGYMYDKVSGQLFGNQGTGAFIIGPDI